MWWGQIEVVLKHFLNQTSFESRCTVLHNELSHATSWQQGNTREYMSTKNALHCFQIRFTCFCESIDVTITHQMQFCDFLTTANDSINEFMFLTNFDVDYLMSATTRDFVFMTNFYQENWKGNLKPPSELQVFNSNKAGIFEGSFSWGGGGGSIWPIPPFPHLPSYFKKNVSNINITLYNC